MYFLILFSLLGVSVGQREFFNKYAYTKAMEVCFGDDYFGTLMRISAAEDECKQVPMSSAQSTRMDSFIYTAQQPGFYADIGGQTVYIPVSSHNPYFWSYGVPHHHIQTRQAQTMKVFGARFLREAAAKIESAISNYTCTLRKLNLIDNNGYISIDQVISEYMTSPIDNDLRNDLVTGITFCRDHVQCMPVESLRTPFPAETHRLLEMMKCERRMRMMACLKHDIRRNLNLFEVSALPNRGGVAGNVEKLAAILIGEDSIDELVELY